MFFKCHKSAITNIPYKGYQFTPAFFVIFVKIEKWFINVSSGQAVASTFTIFRMKKQLDFSIS